MSEVPGSWSPDRAVALPAGPDAGSPGTGLVLVPIPGELPRVVWFGPDGVVGAGAGWAADIARTVGGRASAPSVHHAAGRGVPLVPEVSRGWFGQPGLRGYRAGQPDGAGLGADWSTAFTTLHVAPAIGGVPTHRGLSVHATDHARALSLLTEIESLPGGTLRIRHTVTNDGPAGYGPYVVAGLDVVLPVPDRATEVLDLTGRWGRERSPQRHPVADGVWLREGRTGKTGHESPTVLALGPAGFGFRSGEVWAVSLAWSGNSRWFAERLPSGQTTLGAGELLLPGELSLAQGESYTTPWVFFAASADGLDGVAAQFHGWQRSLAAHPPGPRPVVGNVWEAVYFDHDLARLKQLADQLAGIGVERFVLDDGWFGGRRNERAGLGDWVVSDQAWPEGLGPIVEHVRGLGLDFGLWFEPEMLNADSDLYRAHPDWVLAVPGRPAPEFRHQLVLDVGRPDVRDHLFGQISAILSAYPIGYVKWDHNRHLGDGAAGDRAGAAGVHRQTEGFYQLLDRLRAAHPHVEWESCASGGGRLDLGVLERVQRVWTSDLTDALSRQQIQRWSVQLAAPEYLGAHVSAPANHQTGRRLSLDFRAATAFFGDFGVEWDVTSASAADRARLGEWIALYKRYRALLHSGRVVRADSPSPVHRIHGVLSPDRAEAVVAYVQLDESVHDPVPFVVPGLDPGRRYRATRIAPEDAGERLRESPADPWRGEGLELPGAVLAAVGLPAPERRPLTCLIVHLEAV